MSNGYLLEIKDLTIKYKNEKTAVDHVSFNVPEKSIVAIVGESGSGKSTMIRSIIGLITAGGQIVEGEILFQGLDLANALPKKCLGLEVIRFL